MTESFPLPDAAPDGYVRAQVFVEEAPALACSTVLPAHFRPVRAPVKVPGRDRLIGTLGTFRDPDDKRPVEVEVVCGWLEREVSPADWLGGLLRMLDAEVVHRRDLPREKGGDAVDLLTRRAVGGDTFVSRWSVHKEGRNDGAHVFAVEARARSDVYADAAESLALAAGGFAPDAPSAWPYAERLKGIGRGQPGDFHTYYPLSWKAGELPAEDGTQKIVVDREVGGEVLAQIELRVGVDLTPDELTSMYLLPMAERGLAPELAPLAERAPFGGLEAAWETRGTAAPSDHRGAPPIDLHLTLGTRGPVTYLFGLFGPARALAPDLAAVHERAYGTVLEQLVTADVSAREPGGEDGGEGEEPEGGGAE